MRESLNKAGHTAVDHVVFDLVLGVLSTPAQAVFLRIYRQTVGWHKPFDEIANSQFRKYTGIKSQTTVRSAISELDKLNLIIILGEGTQKRSYGINWDTIEKYMDEGEDKRDEEQGDLFHRSL